MTNRWQWKVLLFPRSVEPCFGSKLNGHLTEFRLFKGGGIV